jgi:hypothetical protein
MRERTVVLAGAGASYGAGRIQPNPPPLGAGLYDALALKFPKDWGPESYLNQFADGFRKDFEKTMWNELCSWKPSLTILELYRQMAEYFGEFSLDQPGYDLYSRLIDLLSARDLLTSATFGSLNYECLLEQALSHSGNRTAVLKPHGSCNYLSVDLDEWKHMLTSLSSHLECDYQVIDPAIMQSVLPTRFSDRQHAFFPIMSLYTMFKDSILGSARIQEIRNEWQERVSEASKIVIIGVRPNPEDHHVWDPIIANPSARGFYIGSRSQLEAWPEASAKLRFVEETFQAGLPILAASL